MLNVGFGEIIVIALVLLMAVGPEQLPGVIRRFGQVLGQARSMTDNLRSEFMAGLDEIERAADVEAWVNETADDDTDDDADESDSDDVDDAGVDDADIDDVGVNSAGLSKSAPIVAPPPFTGMSSADPATRANGGSATNGDSDPVDTPADTASDTKSDTATDDQTDGEATTEVDDPIVDDPITDDRIVEDTTAEPGSDGEADGRMEETA